MLEYLVNTTRLSPGNLRELSMIPPPNNAYDIIFHDEYYLREFERLAMFFTERGLAKMTGLKKESSMTVENGIASNFNLNGGFANAFRTQTQSEKKEAVELEKSKIALELSSKIIRDLPRIQRIALSALFIAVCLALMEIGRILRLWLS
ncbi:MAG: hypothetical protein HRT65_14440 [Flavobacteriaceae bacterium]|nr:hypothetical protein [Flavobacteriaceae bacterium]